MNSDAGNASADSILDGDFSYSSKQSTELFHRGNNRWVEEINTELLGLQAGPYENIRQGWVGAGVEWLAKTEELPEDWLQGHEIVSNPYAAEMQQEYLELMLWEYEHKTGNFTDFKYGLDFDRRSVSIGPYSTDPTSANKRIFTDETLIAAIDQLAAVEALTITDGKWQFYHHGTEDDFHYYRELVYIHDDEVIGSVNVEIPDGS